MNLRGRKYAPYSLIDEQIAFDLYIVTTNPNKREAVRMAIVERHLRLVVKIAGSCKSALPIEDRISEGTLALMRCIDRFDHESGTRFSYFATPYVRGAILAASRAGTVIQVPYHAREDSRPTTTSMDAPIGDGPSWSLHDIMAAPDGEDVDRRIALDQLLARMPARHAEVLRGVFAGKLTDREAVNEATRIARKILREDDDET